MMQRLLRATAAVTLGAAVIGALRQRLEYRTRQDSTVQSTPPVHFGTVGQFIANWDPQRPRTAAGRLAAALWTAPLTATGLAIGILSRGRPHLDREHGAIVFDGVRGLSGLALGSVGAHANTVGQVVLSTRRPTPAPLLAHEVAHVRQAERLGPLVLPVYALLGARYGYRAHPLEQIPRRHASELAAGS